MSKDVKSMNTHDTNQNAESPEIYAARLSLIGTALSTLGDGLQTVAAAIVLRELENANEKKQNTEDELDIKSHLEVMQRQIDHIARTVDGMQH